MYLRPYEGRARRFHSEDIPSDSRRFGFDSCFLCFEAFADPVNCTLREDFFVFLERVPPVAAGFTEAAANCDFVVNASGKDDLGGFRVAARTHRHYG